MSTATGNLLSTDVWSQEAVNGPKCNEGCKNTRGTRIGGCTDRSPRCWDGLKLSRLWRQRDGTCQKKPPCGGTFNSGVEPPQWRGVLFYLGLGRCWGTVSRESSPTERFGGKYHLKADCAICDFPAAFNAPSVRLLACVIGSQTTT